MQIDWTMIRHGSADALDGATVELGGWMIPPDPAAQAADYFLLAAESPCCGGCVPRDPLACVEVYAASPLALQAQALGLRGRLVRLRDDPAGWRYQLRDAQPLDAPAAGIMSRRAFLASGAALGLAACAPGRFAGYTEGQAGAAGDAQAEDAPPGWKPAAGALTIDMHSHAGRVIVSRDPAIGARRPFLPLAAPMRAGGMHVICLAIVTDTTVTRVSANRLRFEAWRTPQEGELYALGRTEFARAQALVAREQMQVVTSAATLAAQGHAGPCAIIAAEGADFLEGRLERVDEAYNLHQLRHLQLTHYRVNELGDIQTEAPVHGGLTDFGAAVVRRCNALGIVVDVAHGTYELVKRAAAASSKPLVISHTALATHPGARSRLISPDHARAIAGTGGVIGVWPSSGTFHSLQAMAEGVKRMADVVGVAHVGLGTDMLGFITPPVFTGYEQLPALGNALVAAGFTQDETGMILGGNYRRVFEASVG
ncbi:MULTISPECIES: dipeptidase [Cupriavidus]